MFFGLLSGIFEGLSDSGSKSSSNDTDYLMPWEQDLVDKGEYEPYHFEEEEMEEDEPTAHGYGVSLGGDENVLKQDTGDGCTTL